MATAKTKTRELPNFAKVLPWLLVIGGLIGLFSSSMLIYDQIKIWENPTYAPSCNLNPIISCGNVISSGQGDLFGIPAPFFGLVAFPVLMTVGIALLAGASFKRWFWFGLQLGAAGGFVFAVWLLALSLYTINALCPFCLSVDVVTFTLVWYITLHNLRAGHFSLGKRGQSAVDFAARHHLDILVLWFVLIIAVILHRFWYYYGQFFS